MIRALPASALVGVLALTLLPIPDADAQGWFGRSDRRDGSAEAAIAALTSRIELLEETVRRLTGEVERLRRAGGQGGALPPVTAAPQLGGPATSAPLPNNRLAAAQPLAAPAQAAQPGGPTSLLPRFSDAPAGGVPQSTGPVGGSLPLGAPPRPLGTIPQATLRGLPAPSGGNAGQLPAAAPQPVVRPGVQVARLSPEDEYTSAYAFILQQDFAGAETAFNDFLTRHPRHELAGNAQYWLGESFYARGAYRRAAQAFLRGYQTYGSSPKAPDSLLKLGMTLAALGETGQACASFDEISQKFPGANPAVRERAVVERDRVGC